MLLTLHRRSRSRFWAKGMEQDKINAYMTLYTCLVTLSKLAAPMIPFMTEEIYQNLVAGIDPNAPESIHLCDYPVADESMIDPELEENMDHVLKAVVLGRAARNESGIKNRQPISRMMIKAAFEIPEFFQKIIVDELNIKGVEFTDEADSFIDYTFNPQLKTVGPKYGKLLGGIRKFLSEVDGKAAMKELKADGAIRFDVNGSQVELAEDDLLIDMAQTDSRGHSPTEGMTVVLDKTLTPELTEEGFVRELISKIQTMRKEAGFEVMDRIKVYASGNEKIQQIMLDNAETIAHDVLADEFIFDEGEGIFQGVEDQFGAGDGW